MTCTTTREYQYHIVGMRCAPIVAGDDDSASAGLLALLDEVGTVYAFASVCLAQLLCELIVAYAAGVCHLVRRKDILQI